MYNKIMDGMMSSKPFKGESYHDWKMRRLRFWKKSLTDTEKRKIRDWKILLSLYIIDLKKEEKDE